MRKGSETKTIMRSQINLNPFNPKHHSDDAIKQQKANIKKVGLLGGIVWNEGTGNLVDGHKRLMAEDSIRKYDGTPDTDYEVKVEAVDFDEKTEKEQMTFMVVANTKPDYNEIAKYIDDIDFKAAGLSEIDAKQIKQLQDDLEKSLSESMDDLGGDFLTPITELPTQEQTSDEIVKYHAEKPKMTAEEVKREKQHCENVAINRQANIDTFVFIDFASVEQKELFCDMLNRTPENSMRVSGDELLRLL